MARIIIKLTLGGASAALAALLVAVPALAYVVGPGSTMSAPAVVTVGVSFTITADFIEPDGVPFPAGSPDTFSESSGPAAATAKTSGQTTGVQLMAAVKTAQSCTASENPVSTTTNSAGADSSTVVLPCPGQYVLTATATGTNSGSVSATVTAESSAAAAQPQAPQAPQAPTGAFPNTTALPPGSSGPLWVGPAIGSAGVVLLIALVTFMVWRQRRSRREA